METKHDRVLSLACKKYFCWFLSVFAMQTLSAPMAHAMHKSSSRNALTQGSDCLPTGVTSESIEQVQELNKGLKVKVVIPSVRTLTAETKKFSEVPGFYHEAQLFFDSREIKSRYQDERDKALKEVCLHLGYKRVATEKETRDFYASDDDFSGTSSEDGVDPKLRRSGHRIRLTQSGTNLPDGDQKAPERRDLSRSLDHSSSPDLKEVRPRKIPNPEICFPDELPKRVETHPNLKQHYVFYQDALKKIDQSERAEIEEGKRVLDAKNKAIKDGNRYSDVFAPRESLVELGSKRYINANSITSLDGQRHYIATQSPKVEPNTMGDFWEMVYEQKSPLIVNLTDMNDLIAEKTSAYWPETQTGDEPVSDRTRSYGAYTVEFIERVMDPAHSMLIRTFKVTPKEGGETRVVKQLHYQGFPDKDKPKNLEAFKEVIRVSGRFQHPNEGPMVVHCSAGLGRAGTFIAAREVLESAETPSTELIQRTVLNIRRRRGGGAVQTLPQLKAIAKVATHKLQSLELNKSSKTEHSSEHKHDETTE